jgi:triosephosphate isomerase
MRQPLIAGNWKMNTTVTEAQKLVGEMAAELNRLDSTEIVLCPPYISLMIVKTLIKTGKIKLGAQNLYFEEKGAFTGEISAMMLADICAYVIIGHSERRQYFQESNQLISKKVAAALKHGIKPILCVGEVLKEYESGRTQQVVTEQINESLAGIADVANLVVAYEPVWAIGTGRAASGIAANQTINLIRNLIAAKYSARASDSLRILYGGSVTAANIQEFVSQPDIDGALVGGASLKAHEFIEIVRKTSETRKG